MTRRRQIRTGNAGKAIHVKEPAPKPVAKPKEEVCPQAQAPAPPAQVDGNGYGPSPVSSASTAQKLKELIEKAHNERVKKIGVGITKDVIDRAWGAVSISEYHKKAAEEQQKLYQKELEEQASQVSIFGNGDFPLGTTISPPPGLSWGAMGAPPAPSAEGVVIPTKMPKILVDPAVPKGQSYILGNGEAVFLNVHDYDAVQEELKDGLTPLP